MWAIKDLGILVAMAVVAMVLGLIVWFGIRPPVDYERDRPTIITTETAP